MSGTLMPVPTMQWFGDDGAPLTNGLVYTYAAGTMNPLATFSDFALTVQNLNPIRLDAEGKAVIYFSALNYKIDVQTSAGASIDSYPRDNVPGLFGIAASAITGTLTVPQGGTGASSLAANAVLIGGGVAPVSVVAGLGTAGQVLTSQGAGLPPIWGGVSVTLDRQVSAQSVVNTGVKTAVYTYSVPGNTLGTDKTLVVKMIGDHLINAGSADSVLVEVKYGATVVFSGTVAAVNPGANRGSLNLAFELTAGNATNVQRAEGYLWVGDSIQNNAGGVGSNLVGTNSYLSYATDNTIAEDSTLAKNIVVSFQCGTASPNIDMRCLTIRTELH